MPGSTPPTSQLDWPSSTTAMIVLSWSKATRDLLKSFSWGIGGTPSVICQRRWCHLLAACPIPSHRWRKPDSNSWSRFEKSPPYKTRYTESESFGRRERHHSGGPKVRIRFLRRLGNFHAGRTRQIESGTISERDSQFESASLQRRVMDEVVPLEA